MGKALEVVSGFATNPGATFTALTMSGSDSASVRNFPNTSRAYIWDQWSAGTATGFIRTRSPRLHDNVNGITLRRAAATTRALLTGYERELLYPQDTLTLEITGGGGEVDAFSTLIYYEDLPGSAARLYSWNEIAPRILHLSGVQVAVTSGGTAGQYSGSVAINNTQDQFKANTDYAILGYESLTSCMTVGIRSADTANLRVAGPGTTEAIETRDWFVRLSDTIGQPAIPVFNAANKFNTIVDVIDVATGTTLNFTFICAELSTPGGQTA
jgi:hypothetical protein